jgi:cobyrinic acid a,c-diamide synthase
MEQGQSRLYQRLAKAALDTVDLDRIEALAHSSGTLPEAMSPPMITRPGRTIRIGVAQDQAFCFYYPDNLELLEAAGTEIIAFSPLHDDLLPDVEMLYLGGGYPELHGATLAENVAMRSAVKRFAERGGAIYAECGGLMYLMESLRAFDGCSHDMVGIFPAETAMQKQGLTLGYRIVECSRRSILGDVGVTARGHEFHYSTLVARGPLRYACALRDATGLSKGRDGLMKGNVLALYTHLHFASHPTIAAALVDSARSVANHVSVSAWDGPGAGY